LTELLFRRTIHILAIAGIMAATSVAAMSASAAELRVSWWGGDARQVATNAALDAISKSKLTDITFVTESQGRAQYIEKLATQIAGGNAPDLVQTASQDVQEFKGVLLDLKPYIDSGALDVSGIDASMLARQGTVAGKVLGIPFSIQSNAVLSNGTVFATYGIAPPAEGWTWEEYGAAAKAISDASGGSIKGAADDSSIYYIYEGWFQARTGKTVWNADGTRNDTPSDLEAWYDYWAGLRSSGAVVAADQQAVHVWGDNTTSLVVTGKAALEGFVSSATGSYQGLMKDLVVPLPVPKGEFPNNFISAGTMFSVPASSKNADQAVATLNLLLNDPEVAVLLSMTRGSPGTVAAREAVAAALVAGDPLKAVVQFDSAVAAGERGAIWPSPAGSSDANGLFARIGQQVAFGELTSKDGAKAFFDQLPGVLNR
jgi:multiple sugar transport system substrate-binding protein